MINWAGEKWYSNQKKSDVLLQNLIQESNAIIEKNITEIAEKEHPLGFDSFGTRSRVAKRVRKSKP